MAPPGSLRSPPPEGAPHRPGNPSGAGAASIGIVMAPPVEYVLRIADTCLIHAQRLAEWCGHGPVLEEDLALANNSLDLIGQARLLYQHAATLISGDGALAQRGTAGVLISRAPAKA